MGKPERQPEGLLLGTGTAPSPRAHSIPSRSWPSRIHQPLSALCLLRPASELPVQTTILLLFRLARSDGVLGGLGNPELPWLPTEQEKVAFFDLLGIDRNRIPHRIYHGAVRKQTRYFALKLPIAADAKTATFAYIDPGNTTDTELRSWGAAHEWLWRALRGKGIKVQVVAIGLDFDDTIRSETALKRWSKGAGKQVEQIAEGRPRTTRK